MDRCNKWSFSMRISIEGILSFSALGESMEIDSYLSENEIYNTNTKESFNSEKSGNDEVDIR